MRTSNLTSQLPVVCILAIEGTRDYKELRTEFAAHISRLEEQVYRQAAANEPNLSDKVHRLQFGSISLARNPKFRNDVVRRTKKPNERYIVYASEVELIGVFNNVQDLEYIVDDVLHGEFGELTPVKDLLEHDYALHELLTNETLSLARVVFFHLTSSLFFRAALFLLAFIVFTRVLRLDHKKALVISGVLIGSMILYGIVEKLLIESLI